MKKDVDTITKIKKMTHWVIVSRALRIIEVVAIIGGVIFMVVQIKDVRNMQSAQLMLEFNRELNNDKNSQIITAIENNKPILVENGGGFNTTDIDKYLSVYDLLNNTHDAGLINDDMLYNGFSYDIIKTYENPEIKNYISEIQKTDDLFFAGFEELAKGLQNAK